MFFQRQGKTMTMPINSNIKERVLEIKQQPGKNIWLYGGGNLITTFVNMGLVDVYRLAVHPVILGAGTPLFKDIREKIALQLINVKTSTSGMALLTYQTREDATANH